MGTARQDYERFVRWIHEPDVAAPASARRFANLVLQHFDEVAAAPRQLNNRSRVLARVAREHLPNASSDPPMLAEGQSNRVWPWLRLHHLTVGPFRGFRGPQGFDVSKRLILCYGPNGSGKSSLCEALEYALLGSVEEAALKRIDPARYLANIHAGRFDAPRLTATNRDGNEVEVRSDEETFRFCFIEKNRIDSFSRLAASTPAKKNDLIATLFGMDQFNDFCSHFNESMDAVLQLEKRQQQNLQGKREALRTDEATQLGEAQRLQEADQAAADYADAYSHQMTFEGLCALAETGDAPCRLDELDALLQAVPPTAVGITVEALANAISNAEALSERLSTATKALAAKREQVSFRDLFASVLELRPVSGDACPACLTPLSKTTSDPFARAESGLRELAELAALETELESTREESHNASSRLRGDFTKLEGYLRSVREDESHLASFLAALPEAPKTLDWVAPISSAIGGEKTVPGLLDAVLAIVRRIEAQDAVARRAIEERERLAEERRRLVDARVWIAEYRTRRAQIVKEAADARTRIQQWQEANADLIERAREEGEANLRDQPIKQAYDEFRRYLDRFRNQLPGMLMADLNATVMELYNEFNQMDRDEDKLSHLALPVTSDGVIEIAFRGLPHRRINALAALSEGHIRCLGLAILLAKVQSLGAPLIIFDDAVNAIDHDHRSGIRAAIFETDRFRRTQIVVTCHSQEFIKDIENCVPRALRDDCQQYVLRHHDGDHQPRVNPDVGSANYLVRAAQALDRHDCREALSFGRKALEMLTERAWRWLESHRLGNISVQLKGPQREPQLRNLCEALRKHLTKLQVFAHPSKALLVQSLDTILSIREDNLVWLLLNKGTHEEPDRDDFDRQHVDLVLRVLNDIDAIELRPGR